MMHKDMCIQYKDAVINKRTQCSVCDNRELIEIMNMPELPITGLFSKEKQKDSFSGIDQSLLWCSKCGQGQLLNQVNPEILYDSQKYTFRTSLSSTAQQGTKVFIDYLREFVPDEKFNCIIDVGCNDLYLLHEIKSFGKVRIGLDPIWTSQENNIKDSDLHVIGGTVEETDLDKVLPCKPDCILSRHTLEHIFDPQLVLEKLIDCATDDALFLFEIPGFDSLITRGRFDQVFHEHLQYFSLSSFEALLNKLGAKLIGYHENYHNWGALMIAFRKKGAAHRNFNVAFTREDIEWRRDLFFCQMDNARKTLYEFKNTNIYGYGAALMLPVLAYHLKSDLSFIKAVIDDDKDKEGFFYTNLPLQVKHSGSIEDFYSSTVFVTAIDNVKPIMLKLLQNRPKHIIYPLHII
ncbi:MAG: methyltransferase domain-containing protein [Nitrospirae bacterium]|nr:methyltransferase domain-containing protein [Nitrospirota bacterium]